MRAHDAAEISVATRSIDDIKDSSYVLLSLFSITQSTVYFTPIANKQQHAPDQQD